VYINIRLKTAETGMKCAVWALEDICGRDTRSPAPLPSRVRGKLEYGLFSNCRIKQRKEQYVIGIAEFELARIQLLILQTHDKTQRLAFFLIRKRSQACHDIDFIFGHAIFHQISDRSFYQRSTANA
jgi:hypothetical protein